MASSGGGEWAGPCPFCGGEDRFRVQPQAPGGGRWLCRQCGEGKWQDAIEFGRRLWPGLFVNAVLTLGMERGAVVVPSEAVQEGQRGSYVFVIKPDMTAEVRPVTVSRSLAHDTVIAKGLAAGEQVVTDGQIRLVTGTKVEFKPNGR